MNTRWIWGTVYFITLSLIPSWVWGQYGGGAGTTIDPFLISTPDHMQAIGENPNDWDKYFELTGNIDLNGFDGEGGNPAYNVIGTNATRFVGQFDGAGFTISNLTINATGTIDIGLFGFVDTGGVIKNLVLINPTVISDSGGVGSLIGKLQSGEVLFCQAQGCTISGTIVIGGLIGQSSNAQIDSCGVTGIVNGDSIVGGLLGQDLAEISSSIIQACFANTTLTSSGSKAGGLIGISEFSIISDCYSTGSVSGNDQVGGLLGRVDFIAPKINRCYAACAVSGSAKIGGLIGSIGTSPVINSSFWDTIISNQSLMCGEVNANCDDSAGRTTAQMQQQATFGNQGWDFVGESTNGTEDIWRICEGTNRPKLAWENILPGDWACPDGIGIEDVMVLSEQWLLENLSGDVGPGAGDGAVNFLDWNALSGSNPVSLADFSDQWLDEGATEKDIAPNGGNDFFDMFDFAEMASRWMTGL